MKDLTLLPDYAHRDARVDRGLVTVLAGEEVTFHVSTPVPVDCLRAPAIAKLAADDGPLQMSLFDSQDLAEIVHPDYPGERLVACRNPALAAQRARKRDDLPSATETLLAKVKTRVDGGALSGQDAIGVAVGKIVNKYKMAKHFTLHIGPTSRSFERDQARIDAEAALDGIYIIRTSVTTHALDAAGMVTAYKQLSYVERAIREVPSAVEDRVKAHVLICMLAAYLVWHLRAALAPLTYTDTQTPQRDNPAPAMTQRDCPHSGEPVAIVALLTTPPVARLNTPPDIR